MNKNPRKLESKSGFGTSRRFSTNEKGVVDVSYNVISEWGIKNNKEKDILNKLSQRMISKSVYH